MKTTKVIGSQAKFLLAVVLAAAIGGAATAVVSASIPDSSGTIHGCYNSKGTLSVIDTDAGQACKSSETALNWSAGSGSVGGGVAGYVYVTRDTNTGAVTLDTARSKGVGSFNPVSLGGTAQLACITFTTAPNAYSVSSVGSTSPSEGEIKTQAGWTDNNPETGGTDSSNDMLCDQNAPGSNAWFTPNGNDGIGYMIVF